MSDESDRNDANASGLTRITWTVFISVIMAALSIGSLYFQVQENTAFRVQNQNTEGRVKNLEDFRGDAKPFAEAVIQLKIEVSYLKMAVDQLRAELSSRIDSSQRSANGYAQHNQEVQKYGQYGR